MVCVIRKKLKDNEPIKTILENTIFKENNGDIEDGSAIARVSAVGEGMSTSVGTAGKMFRALANAEQRFLDENPGILNIITRQALMDKYIQQGRIDDAVTEGNKAQELTENLLQMAK